MNIPKYNNSRSRDPYPPELSSQIIKCICLKSKTIKMYKERFRPQYYLEMFQKYCTKIKQRLTNISTKNYYDLQ